MKMQKMAESVHECVFQLAPQLLEAVRASDLVSLQKLLVEVDGATWPTGDDVLQVEAKAVNT